MDNIHFRFFNGLFSISTNIEANTYDDIQTFIANGYGIYIKNIRELKEFVSSN